MKKKKRRKSVDLITLKNLIIRLYFMTIITSKNEKLKIKQNDGKAKLKRNIYLYSLLVPCIAGL